MAGIIGDKGLGAINSPRVSEAEAAHQVLEFGGHLAESASRGLRIGGAFGSVLGAVATPEMLCAICNVPRPLRPHCG
jgi:hypothetical protein